MDTIAELVKQLQAAAIISGDGAKVTISEEHSTAYNSGVYKPTRVEAYKDCVKVYIQRS